MPFDFEVKKSRRKTLAIEVRAGKVIVRSPLFLGHGQILRFVQEKSDWINKKIQEMAKVSNQSADEAVKFLGEYLAIKDISGSEIVIDLENKIFYFPEAETASLKLVIKRFYLQKTQELVEQILRGLSSEFDFDSSKITYKFYKSKWGSCSGRNNLSFNGYLSSAPFEVIRYVVVHELCHLKIKNHQKEFWRKVALYDEDYKKRRKYLRENHIRII